METGDFHANINSKYCEKCQTMLSPAGRLALYHEAGFLHHSEEMIRLSARASCPLCSMLLEACSYPDVGFVAALRTAQGSSEDRVVLWASARGWKEEDAADKPVHTLLEGLYTPTGWPAIAVTATEGSKAAKSIRGRALVTDVASDAAFALATSWLSECLNAHERCPKYAASSLPKRVLDVGKQVDDPTIRLYVPKDPNEIAMYVALSYCWGGPQRSTATIDNEEALQKGISLAILPQTIKDAVVVTRKLGFRYLWVDALCILQDCPKDKETEIHKMDKIYQNAVFTIVASVAKSVEDGFLHPAREPVQECPYMIELPDGTRDVVHLSARRSNYIREPLDGRAWTFQEGLLSMRSLRYSSKEMVWTCRSETIPHQQYSPQMGDMHRPSQDLSHSHTLFPVGLKKASLGERLRLWTLIVEQYSNRELSDRSDRLNALAGIAAYCAQYWDDHYMFGLWKSMFVELLAWKVVTVGSTRSTRAPTWSWGSMDCKVDHPYMGSVQRYDDDGAILESTNGPPRGFSHGIVLNGKLAQHRMLPPFGGDAQLTNFWDEPDAPQEIAQYLLLGSHDTLNHDTCTGLIVINSEVGIFRRVGVFQIAGNREAIWGSIQRQDVILV